MIKEESSAHIEGNEIVGSCLANIALGGVRSVNTVIVNNDISYSEKEGIFVILAEKCQISRNRIFNNTDGLVIATGIPLIFNNIIRSNRSNGVVSLLQSNPTLQGNEIKENKGVGLLVKESSTVLINGNNDL